MIDRQHKLPIASQCKILSLSRSTAYYREKELTEEEARALEEEIQKFIDSLPKLTPEQLAMFDKYGDLIQKPEDPTERD